MKLALVQMQSVTGDILQNSQKHLAFIQQVNHADFVLFPELSLTGYEPTLAEQLAISLDDTRLDRFQTLAETYQMTIALGAPLQTAHGVMISLLIFQPHQPRAVYAKQHLHEDETPFFVAGAPTNALFGQNASLALAICYELSVAQHAEQAYQNGAGGYVASVAKFSQGVQAAHQRLATIAQTYKMWVCMCNGVGEADGGVCAGGTAVWNPHGTLLAQLDESQEAILIFDTQTEEVKIYSYQEET